MFRSDSSKPIRTKLFGLVLVALVPNMLIAIWFVYSQYQWRVDDARGDVMVRARTASQAVDARLMQVQALLQGLAASDALRTRDMERFHRLASELAVASGLRSILMLDSEGQQVVNTRVPFGEPLPNNGPGAISRKVILEGKPITRVVNSKLTGAPVIGINVPVNIDGATRYSLSATLDGASFVPLLRGPVGMESLGGVIDGTGVIAARTLLPEQYVGKPVTANMKNRIEAAAEGSLDGRTLDGIEVHTAFAKGEKTGWAVAISVPKAALLADLRRSISYIAVAIAGIFAISFLAAWSLARRIGQSTDKLVSLSSDLLSAADKEPPRLAFREANVLGQAIVRSSRLLRESWNERERQQDNVIRTNAELRQFAHVASHDLRSPLRTIIGFLAVIEDRHGAAMPAEALSMLRRSLAAARRLDAVTLDLLAYARLDRKQDDFAEVDLDVVARDCLAALDADVQDTHAQVTLQPLPKVRGHAGQLGQVMQNLLSNAMRYRRGDAPRIEVSARDTGTAWEISVRDDGIGIAPEHHKRVFEMFQRLHSQDAIPGTGVGLAICRKIVENHGGSIRVESAEGQGSTFRFSLPKEGS